MGHRTGPRGFSLVDVMLVVALVAAAIITGMWYSGKATQKAKAADTVSAITKIALATRTAYRSMGSYEQLSASTIANVVALPPPFKWDGSNITDAWGSVVRVSGSPVGQAPSFAISIGGGPAPMSLDECVAIGSGLAGNAQAIYVDINGSQPMLSQGRIIGGYVYSSATQTPSATQLSNMCAYPTPGLAFQFR